MSILLLFLPFRACKRYRLPLSPCLAGLMLLLSLPANSREQSEMQHPSGPPPSAPIMAGGAVPATWGLVPKTGSEFWRGQIINRVPPGTILTGILEQDLSSKKSKPNDVFTILLSEGLVISGKQMIPPQSKILGSVVAATPASQMHAGQHGQIQIALHQLITPDGRSIPIYAFIAHNSNHDYKKPAAVDQPGQQIKDTPNMVSAFFGSFTAGVGARLKQRHQGKDFHMEKGEVLPVRLNRSLDCSAIASQAPSSAGQPPANQVPGLIERQPPANQTAGLTRQTPANQAAGLSGQTPANPVAGAVPANQPGLPTASVPGLVEEQDDSQGSNNIFNQPLTPQSLSDMPDPF